jgi:hypothetical protein
MQNHHFFANDQSAVPLLVVCILPIPALPPDVPAFLMGQKLSNFRLLLLLLMVSL